MDKEKIERLKLRTRDYAINVVKFCADLPNSREAAILAKQLVRSGTSVGAQYREACRGKSNADFISKIEGCLQELEETQYWLEILMNAGFASDESISAISRETQELLAIFTTVVKKVKSR